MSLQEQLKAELKALLEKYDCHILADVDEDSDFHGIFGEKIEILENKRPHKVLLSFEGGWCIDAEELSK